jgi:hypothetical protein
MFICCVWSGKHGMAMQVRCEHSECSSYMHRPLTVNSMLIIYMDSVYIYIYIYISVYVGRECSMYVPFCVSSCLRLSLSLSV